MITERGVRPVTRQCEREVVGEGGRVRGKQCERETESEGGRKGGREKGSREDKEDYMM